MNHKPVLCVVFPSHSPIDKVVAAKRVELDLGSKYQLRFKFCNVNVPTQEMIQGWNAICSPEAGPAYLVDIGEKKYHKSAGSAAEVEKMSSPTTTARTYNRLVELVNQNNKSGFLKNARHSIAKLLRDIYEIPPQQSEEFIFRKALDVVDGFFFRPNGRTWQDLFDKDKPEYETLRQLWEGFNVTEDEVRPFTIPMYFSQLFMSGRSVAEITEKVTWWINKGHQVDKLREAAEQKKYDVGPISVGVKEVGCVQVESVFEFGAFSQKWIGTGKLAVAIIRNQRGQVHIASSYHHKVNFDKLAAALGKLEPGLWYYETRFKAGPMLMNGSRQFTGVPATGFTSQHLVSLVVDLVEFGK